MPRKLVQWLWANVFILFVIAGLTGLAMLNGETFPFTSIIGAILPFSFVAGVIILILGGEVVIPDDSETDSD